MSQSAMIIPFITETQFEAVKSMFVYAFVINYYTSSANPP